MIDGKNLFHQAVEKCLGKYDNIRKVATGQGVHWTTGCLLDYNYFNNYYKIIVIDLRKQQALDADPNGIQYINFKGNVAPEGNTNIITFFSIEEVKETF